MSPEKKAPAKLVALAALLLLSALLFFVWKRVSRQTTPPKNLPGLLPLDQPLPIGHELPPAPTPPVPVNIPAPVLKRPPVAKRSGPLAVVKHPSNIVPVLPVPTVRPALPVVRPTPPPPPPPQQWQGHDTAINHQGNVVVHNDEQWIRFWGEHHPHEAAPDVDFSQNMVVGVFPGSRPADGFQVEITGVRQESKNLVVDFREIAPPLGTFAVGVTIFPYHFKVVPRSTQKVKFNRLNT